MKPKEKLNLLKIPIVFGYVRDQNHEIYSITDKNNTQFSDKSYTGWSLIGADIVEGINRTAWKHDTYGYFFHKHDANWQEISGGSSEAVGSPAFYNMETSFDQDLNNDGYKGSPPPKVEPIKTTFVEQFGSISLAKDESGDGYIAPAGTDDFIPITDKDGNPLGDNSYEGWKLVGADTVDGINRTAWKHDSFGFFFHKHDENWKEIPGGTGLPPGSNDFYILEEAFEQDFDGDGFKGTPTAKYGIGSFLISGTIAVGETLSIEEILSDPDGVAGVYSYSWQTSSDSNTWTEVGTDSTYFVAASEEGKSIRAIISYKDAKGFSERITTSSENIPYVNNGKASYSIIGNAAVGNTLNIRENNSDPDGTGTLTYSWQTSNDGINWNEVSTSSAYEVNTSDEGKSIKAIISYKDDQGFDETVNTPIKFINTFSKTLTGRPLSGSFSRGEQYRFYEGYGGNTAIEDFNLIDLKGDNQIKAINEVTSDKHYNSFAISNSNIRTGEGNDTYEIKNSKRLLRCGFTQFFNLFK